MGHRRRLLITDLLLDGEQINAAPGAVLLDGHNVIAAGDPQTIGEVAEAERIEQHGSALVPALVNVHTHLDLTHLGPREFNGTFTDWAAMIRRERATHDADICASVQQGAARAMKGGIAAVGDIAGAGSFTAIDALRDTPLVGVSYLEVFGIDSAGAEWAISKIDDAMQRVEHEQAGVRLGIQPHAPYSCSDAVYAHASKSGLPMSTHLAETIEERQLIDHGDGPLANMLRSFGINNPSVARRGGHPIEALAAVLADTPCVAAHLNDIDETHVSLLAQWRIAGANCSRRGSTSDSARTASSVSTRPTASACSMTCDCSSIATMLIRKRCFGWRRSTARLGWDLIQHSSRSRPVQSSESWRFP